MTVASMRNLVEPKMPSRKWKDKKKFMLTESKGSPPKSSQPILIVKRSYIDIAHQSKHFLLVFSINELN